MSKSSKRSAESDSDTSLASSRPATPGRRSPVQRRVGSGAVGDHAPGDLDAAYARGDAHRAAGSSDPLLEPMEGLDASATAAPSEQEDPFAWLEQKHDTYETFNRLREEIGARVDDWRTFALIDGPSPPDWRAQLLGVASMVLGGVIGFVSARMIAGLVRPGLGKEIGSALIRTGDARLRAEMTKSIDAGLSAHPDHEQKAALVAFSISQRDALKDALGGAQTAFDRGAGKANEQRMSSADMVALAATNQSLLGELQGRIDRDLTVGWMNLLFGGEGIKSANLGESGDQVGDLENDGALVLELVSNNGFPTISRARADGLGPAVQTMLAGKPLRYWLGGGDQQFPTGVDLVLLTKYNSYVLPDYLYQAIAERGGYGDEPELRRAHNDANDTLGDRILGGGPRRDANDLQVVHFGLGRARDGAWSWVSDYGGWAISDEATGWKAGRILIDEILGGREGLLTFLLDQPIPRIG